MAVLLPPNAFSGLKISHTCICGRGFRELTVLPQPPSWLRGRASEGVGTAEEGEGRERRRKGRE